MKIERLLETYKKMDEEAIRKAHLKESNSFAIKKSLRDKFGFSDDEEDEEEEEERDDESMDRNVFKPKAFIHST